MNYGEGLRMYQCIVCTCVRARCVSIKELDASIKELDASIKELDASLNTHYRSINIFIPERLSVPYNRR